MIILEERVCAVRTRVVVLEGGKCILRKSDLSEFCGMEQRRRACLMVQSALKP
jgi:hypothetical protein